MRERADALERRTACEMPNIASITGRVTLFITVNGVASNPVSFWVE